MIQRTSGTPCLGERVSALADGSLAADVRDRALAHVTGCAQCREALEVERLLVQRLRELPAPAPSGALLQQLLALGETGGPVAPRSGRVAGTPRQPTTALSGLSTGPTARATPAVRPGTTSRPSGRREHRRAGRVLAAAGAFGVGVLAATTIGSALPSQRPVVGPPAASLSVQRDGGVRGGVNNGGIANNGGTVNNASFMRLATPGTLARPTTVPAVGAESGRAQSGR